MAGWLVRYSQLEVAKNAHHQPSQDAANQGSAGRRREQGAHHGLRCRPPMRINLSRLVRDEGSDHAQPDRHAASNLDAKLTVGVTRQDHLSTCQVGFSAIHFWASI
jgi:hypothetical protein